MEKFEEKSEAPRYRKWVKRIKLQVEKGKLDLAKFQEAIMALCGLTQVKEGGDEGDLDRCESNIQDTLDNWI